MNQPLIPEALAAEVRAEMGRQRRTRREVAQVIGVTAATLARRLDGSVPFDTAELDAVGRSLGVTASQLLARAEVAAGTTNQAAS